IAVDGRTPPQCAALGKAVRPAVARAALHFGHVVGRRAAAGPIALVDGGPQRARRGMKRQADGVAQAARESLLPRAVGVVADDRGAAVVAPATDNGPRPRGDARLSGTAERAPPGPWV